MHIDNQVWSFVQEESGISHIHEFLDDTSGGLRLS